MRFPFHNIMRMVQKVIIFCTIFIMINGIINGVALTADRDVIIGFKKPVGPSEEALIHSHGGIAKKSFHLIPAIAARLSEDKIEELKKDPRIAYIEKERIYKAADEYSNSWGVQHIGTQTVHNQSIYGDGVKIAVLDTGIDYNHPDLATNYKGGYDFVYNDSDPIDYNGHGTHVSGIIAAKNNGIGVIGVAPNSSIYAVSVLSPSGDGLTSWIISGIEWAVENNMTIATMSFTCNPSYYQCDDPALHAAIDNAYNSGLLLVAAGGNTNGGEVRYPAAYGSVIAVTATDQNDKNTSFDPIGSKIELAAPGVNILSTVPTGLCALCNPSGYRYLSGTSMATPHVAGVAALIYQSNRTDVNGDGIFNNTDVRLILQRSARDLGGPGKDNIYGFGLVDAQKAVLGIEYVPPEESKEPFVINLTLVRTKGPEIDDAKNISTYQGNYSVKIKNVNLTKVYMVIYENGTIRKDLSSYFKFNKFQEIDKNIYVNNTFNIVFIPYGDKGTIGYVTIRRL